MKRNGATRAVIGLAVCLWAMSPAAALAQPDISSTSRTPGIVTFSPDSPVPPNVSPEAKAYFLRQRPAPGAPLVFVPDCTDPAQRAAFLQYRHKLAQYWDLAAQASPIPWRKVDTTIEGVAV